MSKVQGNIRANIDTKVLHIRKRKQNNNNNSKTTKKNSRPTMTEWCGAERQRETESTNAFVSSTCLTNT